MGWTCNSEITTYLSTHYLKFGSHNRKPPLFNDGLPDEFFSTFFHYLQVKLFLMQVDGLTDGYLNEPEGESMDIDPFGL